MCVECMVVIASVCFSVSNYSICLFLFTTNSCFEEIMLSTAKHGKFKMDEGTTASLGQCTHVHFMHDGSLAFLDELCV